MAIFSMFGKESLLRFDQTKVLAPGSLPMSILCQVNFAIARQVDKDHGLIRDQSTWHRFVGGTQMELEAPSQQQRASTTATTVGVATATVQIL